VSLPSPFARDYNKGREEVAKVPLADVLIVIDNQKYEDEGEAEERERKTWEWLVVDEPEEPGKGA
jgi:hypothetical protein